MSSDSLAQGLDIWTIERVLRWTSDYFRQRGLGAPRLDAELLLAHTLGVGRVHLYTHYDQPLSPSERAGYRELIRRRAGREPVAYILGTREFYGRDFAVDPSVLVPRPETEMLIDAALTWLQHKPAPRILDVGTGSGVLAVTLAAEIPDAELWAIDCKAGALEVARANGARHGVGERIRWVCGDLYAGLTDTFDVIVSNPPYVTLAERSRLDADVRDFEPAEALYAGEDGLTVIRRLLAGAPSHLHRPGVLLCEHGATQGDSVRLLAQAAGSWARLETLPDLQGLPRVLLAVTGSVD